MIVPLNHTIPLAQKDGAFHAKGWRLSCKRLFSLKQTVATE